MKTIKNPLKFVRRISVYTLGLLFVLFLSLVAYSAPADPDNTFGQNGSVLTEFDNTASVQVVLIQPDKKIIAAGIFYYPAATGNYDFAIARYSPDGTLDPTFGTN